MPRASRPSRFPIHGPELKALLAACHREPADDTPRLVLADWLQEHDDPRGELVRLQVRLDALPAGDPEYDSLYEQYRNWWKQFGKLWEKEFGGLGWDDGPHNRGLPTIGHYDDEACWLDTEELEDRAKNPKDRLSAALAVGWPGMTWVLAEDPLDNAEGIEFDAEERANAIEVCGFDHFRAPPWVGSPTPVGVCFPEGITITAGIIDSAATVPNIRGLSLAEADANPDVLSRVARIKALEYLDVGSLLLDDGAVRTLAPLKKLRSLVVRESNLTNAGAAELAKFKQLRILRLPTRRLTAAGYQALAKLTKLEDLELEKADDAAIRLLAPLKRLRRLGLSGTSVTGRGIENFPLLTELSLDATRADDAGIAGVAKLPRLQFLDVSGTRITGAALAHVAGLRWLEELYLSQTALADKDLVHLEGLKNLNLLSIWGTRATKKGARKLKAKLKKASIL